MSVSTRSCTLGCNCFARCIEKNWFNALLLIRCVWQSMVLNKLCSIGNIFVDQYHLFADLSLEKKSIMELWVTDMDLVRVDTDYRSVFLVEALDLPDILTIVDDLIIEFVCKSQGCQAWTRERGDQREVQAINNPIYPVQSHWYQDASEQL